MDFDEATLPSTLTVEHEGKPIPLRDVPFVKEAKDIGSLIKQGYDAHREVGARVRIPAKEKTEDVAAFRTKLIEAGILDAPVGKPEDYAIAIPKEMPEGLKWDDALAGEFRTTMHKHGVPKGAAQELINLHFKAMGTTIDGVMAGVGLKVNPEESIATLKTEFGDKYDDLRADAGRLAGEIFKTPEELAFFENTGLGDHPKFLSILMRLAPLAKQDSSFMPDANRVNSTGVATSREAARAEIADIMRDPTPDKPAHPMHASWKKNGKEATEYIDKLYSALATGTRPI